MLHTFFIYSRLTKIFFFQYFPSKIYFQALPFAPKILSGRKLRALSQENLANEFGVSKQMISKYERGLSVPSSNVLIKLAKSLQVNLDYLFTPPAVKFGSVTFRKKSRLPINR